MGLIVFGGNKSVKCHEISQPATTSGVAVIGACGFGGIVLKTDGTNDVTVNIYDALGAAGRRFIPTDTVVSGTNKIFAIQFDPPIHASVGVYVSVSVAGAGSCAFQVLYDKGATS